MKYKKYIVLIFLIAFNLRLGISSVPPILPFIKSSLALTNFQASLLTSIPVICMGIFAFFVENVQRKVGRSKGLFILLFILGVSTLARAFVQNFSFLISTTFFIGAAIAMIGPLLSGFIKEKFPNNSGLVIGVYSLSMGLGSVCASSTMLPLFEFFEKKWQFALAFWGIIALAISFLSLSMLQKKDNKGNIKKSQKLSVVISHFYMGKMILFFGVQSGIFYGFMTWIGTYLNDQGISPLTSAQLLTLFTSIQMIGSFIIPALMDKFGSVKKWIYFCTVAMLVGSMGFLMFDTMLNNILMIVLIAIGASGLFPIAMLLPIQSSSNANEASVTMSIVQAFGYILGGSIPIVMGTIIDWTGNFSTLFFQIMIGTVCLFIIGSTIKSEGEPKNDEATKLS